MQNNIRKKILLLILICLVITPVFSNNWVQLDSVQLAKTKAKIINNMKLNKISDQEIATMTGILLRTVRDYIKRYDLPRKD